MGNGNLSGVSESLCSNLKIERQIIECETELPNRPVYFVHWVDFHHLKGIFFNTLGQIKEYLDLGIITQDEFDEKAKPLKKILLDD